MEILQSFFDEAETIISENMKKGYYEGEKKESDQITMLEAILNHDEDVYKNVVKDVDYETSSNSVSELQEKLLSLNPEARLRYAGMIAKDLDAKLFNVYCGMRNLDTYGYSIGMFKKSIREYTQDIVEAFGDFDIDLVYYLKQNDGDLEMEFGAYDEYRCEQFVKEQKHDVKEQKHDEKELDKSLLSFFYDDGAIMNKFLSCIKDKKGKTIAIEIKALLDIGKVDFSKQCAFLHSINIDKKQQDGVIRYFRRDYKGKLSSTDENVISAKEHYNNL